MGKRVGVAKAELTCAQIHEAVSSCAQCSQAEAAAGTATLCEKD